LDRAAVAAVVDQLAGDHLALAIGVGRDHQIGGLCQQLLDDLELRGGLGLDHDLPVLGNDGQRFQRPSLVLLTVGFRGSGLDQMADAPGHAEARAGVAAVASLRGAQDAGDVLALGRLLAQNHAHEAS